MLIEDDVWEDISKTLHSLHEESELWSTSGFYPRSYTFLGGSVYIYSYHLIIDIHFVCVCHLQICSFLI